MFCPKCGRSDQQSETYCRQCGVFLPNLDKLVKKETAPEEHLTANTFFSGMTVVVSFVLAALLYSILAFRPDTHWLVYVTAGFLLAIGGWHIQTFVRTRALKKQWKRRTPSAGVDAVLESTTARSLDPANLENAVPASVTENTTRELNATKLRSSQSEH